MHYIKLIFCVLIILRPFYLISASGQHESRKNYDVIVACYKANLVSIHKKLCGDEWKLRVQEGEKLTVKRDCALEVDTLIIPSSMMQGLSTNDETEKAKIKEQSALALSSHALMQNNEYGLKLNDRRKKRKEIIINTAVALLTTALCVQFPLEWLSGASAFTVTYAMKNFSKIIDDGSKQKGLEAKLFLVLSLDPSNEVVRRLLDEPTKLVSDGPQSSRELQALRLISRNAHKLSITSQDLTKLSDLVYYCDCSIDEELLQELVIE